MNIDWTAFTPWQALGGGLLIGLAASLLLLANGRIAGISGILGGLLGTTGQERRWRLAFIGGLLLAPALWASVAPYPQAHFVPNGNGDWFALALGGLLVGFGTRLANGCTSGHGVCGLARFSRRSLLAVGTFMGFGFATVFVVRHLLAA